MRATQGLPDGQVVRPPVADKFSRTFWKLGKQTWRDTSWLGVPVMKLPLDLWVFQEVVMETRPELIVETGTRFGGSTIFFATLLDLIGKGSVISLDINHSDVDERVRAHPRITLVEGSSTSDASVDAVREVAKGRRTMIDLDSHHSTDHVGEELSLFASLVTPGCYLIVEDTIVDAQPGFPDHGAGPGVAVEAWLKDHPEFEVDRSREKFMASFQPGGYLRRRDDVPAGTES